MHEYSICQGIIDVATAALGGAAGPGPAVSRVGVRIGRLTSVVPATLRHYFELLAVDTPLAGAVLDIEEVPVRARCGDCAARFEIDTLSFRCPRCGSGLVELLSGRELEVLWLDTAEEVPCAG